MLCPVCNHEIEGSPRFCNKCGTKLELSPTTADAPMTEAAADAFIGKTVGGRFKIVKLLGEGGMGAVYLGEQNVGGTLRKVAIKTLHQHLSSDPKIKQRFERECATVAELQHPNTIQLYDFGTTDDGILYMVMEFVSGESLASILEKKGALEPARAEHILQQICDALGEAHALGIVHRDLKPDNIVLTERAKDWVKVLDFGIAKRSEAPDKQEQKLTQQGTVLGTPPYMSPEQFTGKSIDARSDIYSIGMIAYEMLSGRLPFSANTPWEWATQHMTVAPQPLSVTPSGAAVPPAMAQAVMRSLAKDPDQRFATTKELYDAFSSGDPPAVAASAAAGAPGGYLLTPAFAPASGPVDQKGKTQIGEPAYSPRGSYGPPPGTGTSPGVFAAGGHYGTPAAGNVAFPVTGGIPLGPPPPQPRGGGGKAVLIALLALLGLLSAAAVGIALTRHPVASRTAGSGTSNPIPVATHADLTATSVPVDTAAALDTSIAPLNTAGGLPIRKTDAGGAATTTPTTTLVPAPPPPPTPAPTPTPTAPKNDPPSCVQARKFEAKNPNPTGYKKRLELENLREQCVRAGGTY
jgi:eukaryotic-like serine/threonine-protein kinase